MSNKVVSETILDGLAAGKSFKELQISHGFSKSDLISAALFGVAELQEEYLSILANRKKNL
ncbi:hypothetical protein HYY75_03185 [bacterium]|nr:hypothetical protein [bacterium]